MTSDEDFHKVASCAGCAPPTRKKGEHQCRSRKNRRPPSSGRAPLFYILFEGHASATLDSNEYMPSYRLMHCAFMSSSVSNPVKL